VGVHPQADLFRDIARLTVSIDRAAAATELALTERLPVSGDGDPRSPLVERKELCRQLAALRDRVARAQDGSEDPRALRAELATLVFFAETLQADADTWRGALNQRIRALERLRAAERQERKRSAMQRAQVVRRRDALEFTIGQTAARMARQGGGECRHTVPVFTLGEGLTVCSVSVSWPRRRFRFAKRWLVTLNGSRDDVLVRRE
jgi:transglutaminase-like putative cysteine protease